MGISFDIIDKESKNTIATYPMRDWLEHAIKERESKSLKDYLGIVRRLLEEEINEISEIKNHQKVIFPDLKQRFIHQLESTRNLVELYDAIEQQNETKKDLYTIYKEDEICFHETLIFKLQAFEAFILKWIAPHVECEWSF